MGNQDRKAIIDQLEARKQSFNVKDKSNAKKSYIFTAIGLVVGLIIGFMIGSVVAGIVIGLIAGFVVTFIVYNKGRKKLDLDIDKEVNEKLLNPMINEMIQDVQFENNGDFDNAEIKSLGLFEDMDKLRVNYYLAGQYNNTPFTYAVLFGEEINEYFEDGETREKKVTVLDSSVTRLTGSRNFEKPVLIFTKGFKYQRFVSIGKNKGFIETEAVEFNKLFSVYSEDEAGALAVLSPGLMSDLIELLNELRNQYAIALKGDQIYFFLMKENRPDEFNQGKKESIQQQLDNILGKIETFAKRAEKVNKIFQ